MFRVDNQDVLPPTYGFVHHFKDLGGASQLRLEGYESVRSAVPAARAVGSSQREVRAELAGGCGRSSRTTGGKKRLNGKPVYLYRLAKTGPPAWLAGEVLVEFDPVKLQQKLASADFDPTRQVLLSSSPMAWTRRTHVMAL